MLNKKERMEKLNNAGINTSKYFTVDLDNGTKIHLIIDEENGVCKQVKDPIMNTIIEDGYVRNTKLHRRFVTAQMFHMLNYVSYDKKFAGYNACLNRNYGYDYTLKMMMEEIRVLSKLEARDRESFVERSHFFNKEVVVAVMEDYLEKLKKYIEALPNRNCKGIPYKRIKKMDVFVEDLSKKIYVSIRMHINEIVYAKNYAQIYNVLEKFARSCIKLPFETPKSKVWIDAYKGAGAFYTLKNLVMFHDCVIYDDDHREMFYEFTAINYLNRKLDEYKGEGWRMFALMKKVIKDNDFDFKARMEEIYNN